MRAGTGIALAALIGIGANPEVRAQEDPPVGGGALSIDAADGISFLAEPGVLYLPVREVAGHLNWSIHWDAEKEAVYLKEVPIPDAETRSLVDGTTLIPVRALEKRGATLGWDAIQNAATVTAGERSLLVRNGAKRVAINRVEQRLRAWQGDRLVLETRVSTGRRGHETPVGSFTAGPYRARRHFSSLYENAPMPYSIQVTGNVFMHGFTSIPPRAASHGCVRIPLTGRNPARWIFRWLDNGSPVVIADSWPEGSATSE